MIAAPAEAAAAATVRAAADTLLTAVAALSIVTLHREPTMDSCRAAAIEALDIVIEKTMNEGARP